MLNQCKISGFADEINDNFDIQLHVLKKLNQQYIEFRSANGKGIAEYSLEDIKKINVKLDSSGINVSAFGSPIGKILITEAFEPHFQLFQHIVALAKILETKYIRIFSFFIPNDEDPNKYEDEVCKRMNRLVEYAKDVNFSIKKI